MAVGIIEAQDRKIEEDRAEFQLADASRRWIAAKDGIVMDEDLPYLIQEAAR